MHSSDPLVAALALLRPRVRRLLAAITLGALSLGSGLALAGLSAWLITRAWQMPPVLDLTVAVVAVRALGISRGVLHYCERLASHDTALRAAGAARERVYARLAAAPIDAAARLRSGELVTRIGSDIDELSDLLVRAVLPIAVAAVLSIAATSVIGAISPVAGAVLAVCLVAAGIVGPWLAARAATGQELVAAQHHSSRDIAMMIVLEHAPELRVGGRLDEFVTETTEQQRNRGRATDRAARPAALTSAVSAAAIGISVVGTVIAGIGLAGSVAPTTLAVLMLLPLSAFEASSALPSAAATLTRARHAARRLAELTDPPAAAPRPRPSPPVAVNLRPRARIAVTGPSGSGKTTLLMDLARTHSGTGFFAEDAHLFATTVRDNLLVARGDCADEELRDALQRAGLGGWLAGLPNGLSTVLTGGADAVSAGQRRRLLLARALISPFAVVLLDEPTEHLDAADGASLLGDVLDPVSGLFPPDRTVVVATHHLPNAGRYIEVHD